MFKYCVVSSYTIIKSSVYVVMYKYFLPLEADLIQRSGSHLTGLNPRFRMEYPMHLLYCLEDILNRIMIFNYCDEFSFVPELWSASSVNLIDRFGVYEKIVLSCCCSTKTCHLLRYEWHMIQWMPNLNTCI